jgi:hypothetical protein
MEQTQLVKRFRLFSLENMDVLECKDIQKIMPPMRLPSQKQPTKFPLKPLLEPTIIRQPSIPSGHKTMLCCPFLELFKFL